MSSWQHISAKNNEFGVTVVNNELVPTAENIDLEATDYDEARIARMNTVQLIKISQIWHLSQNWRDY